MHTRTTTAALIAAGLLATLTGCSDTHEPPVEATPSATVDKAAQYLATARDIEYNGAPTDAELEAFPPQWCDVLDDGHSVEWAFGLRGGNLYPSGQTWGTVKDDAYKLLIAGVRAYCPAHLSAVQSELRDGGEY